MADSLQEKYAEAQGQEVLAKLAAIESAWGEEPEVLDFLSDAYELIKEAEESGEVATMEESGRLNLAVNMVTELLEEMAAEGGDDEAEAESETEEVVEEEAAPETETEEAPEEEAKLEEVDQEKVATYETFVQVGRVLASHGVTQDDLEKIATDDEREALAETIEQILEALATAK